MYYIILYTNKGFYAITSVRKNLFMPFYILFLGGKYKLYNLEAKYKQCIAHNANKTASDNGKLKIWDKK
jgi:hypothetical protein